MMKQLSSLKALLGLPSWSRQVHAWRFGVLASIFETAGLAALLPLMTLILSSETVQLGPLTISRWAAFAVIIVLYGTGLGMRTLALQRVARTTLVEGYALSAQLFGRVLEQPQAWHSKNHSADVRAVLLHDAQELMTLVTIPMGRLFAQCALVISVSLVLVMVRPIETIIAAVMLGTTYFVIFRISGKRLRAITDEQIRHHAHRQRYSTDALTAIREVKLSQLEPVFARSFATASEGIAMSGGQRTVLTELPKLMLEAVLFLLLVSFMLVLTSGGSAEQSNALPTLVLFGVAGLKLFPIGHLVYANLASLRSGRPLLDKLTRFSEGLSPAQPEEYLPRMKQGFSVKNVSLTHDGNTIPTLENLSFSVQRGQSLAITGASGSGKSTLIDIIAGLIQPDTGVVEIDGVALTPHKARSWQRQLRYCAQSPNLFDTDVTANITDGDVVDNKRLTHALHLACLDDLQFPISGQSVGERGRRLSGGQVQRIGLARAFYIDAPIYILDEPTSNLDAQTADRFMDRLFSAQGDAIFVIVTHDLALAERCKHTRNLGVQYGQTR